MSGMDQRIQSDPHISSTERTTSPVLSPSPVITPPKSKSRALLTDLTGWPHYSDKRLQAPGDENGGAHPSGSLTSNAPSRTVPTPGAHHKPSHLPTPHSPGNMTSYLLTRTPTSSQNSLPPDHASDVLPTEFEFHPSSPSPAPLRSHSIPTPDSSPLVARSRGSGPYSLSQLGRTKSHDEHRSSRDDLRASTPRTPSRQVSTRPITPMVESRPITPLQWRSTEHSSGPSHPGSNIPTMSPPSVRIKDEPGTDTTQLIDSNPSTTELRRPDYFKRTTRLASGSPKSSGPTLASESGAKDALLWSANMGTIDSPTKGKRIALFQETSDESFEERLMAGGYANYRSDKPSWKVDGDTEAPKPLGDATAEDPGSGALTEAEKRKKARLAAFFHRRPSSAQLLPVEVEGCGRVLVKVESSESQTLPKPTPKAKRSRKRKKMLDVKQDVDTAAAPKARTVDVPNWPDMEFPWGSRLMTADGLTSTEREERLRYISSFLDRESDEDAEEEETSSPTDASSQSPRSGLSKLLLLRKVHGHGATGSVIPCDPADARVALMSKKSIRAVQLRLLRRRNTDRSIESDDGEVLCICRRRDDGRPLVQCDACRTWYHLECIGIQSTSELGREEDPWFCGNCVEVNTPPPVVPKSEPTFAVTDGEQEIGYDPFLNAGLHPSPLTPLWTRPMRLPTTPPCLRAPRGVGSSWDELPSSSSRGDPRTPQFGTASGFGDTVRVHGSTPGRLLEPGLSTRDEFDPTSTPSRGIMFGLPFATPKDGRWRGELFHTPKRPGEDGTASVRYHGRVGETPEEGPSGTQGLFRTTGNNVTPVERTLKRMEGMESPLGTKKSRRR